ncbi:MAG: RNA polymerase sigma-70 factor [Odoribacteraceae bacterium]|jgi:RNA polymerase sigma-70 factor (ECF subfamily)|nr:RNA polymerase sigma-70 factor [Odoribacteraceae bacterium]
MKISETYFIELLNRKELLGFRVLYRDYYRTMVSFGMNYTRQRESAEDIVQELFTSIWRRELRFDSLSGLKTFLFTAIKNACLNELKKEQVRKEYLLSLPPDEPLDENDDREWIEEEVYRRVFLAMEKLPPRCKEIFKYHLQGLKNDEIAARLNISIATVKTQKNRAMNFLREEVSPPCLLLFLGVACRARGEMFPPRSVRPV